MQQVHRPGRDREPAEAEQHRKPQGRHHGAARGGSDRAPRERDGELAPRRRNTGTTAEPTQQQPGAGTGEQAQGGEKGGDDQHGRR